MGQHWLSTCSAHLLAGLQRAARVEGAEVAPQGVPSIVHPVVHRGGPCRNDDAGISVKELLVLTCCVGNGPLQTGNEMQ